MNHLIHAFIEHEGVTLTRTQRELLEPLLTGKRQKEIGEQFFSYRSTFQYHLTNINKKFNVQSRPELLGKYIIFLEGRIHEMSELQEPKNTSHRLSHKKRSLSPS